MGEPFGNMEMTPVSTETKQLWQILAGVEHHLAGDLKQVRITNLCTDSRQVRPGSLFVALEGLTSDGHHYIEQAVAAGCAALLVNRGWRQGMAEPPKSPSPIPVVEVEDTRTALGPIAANFYDHPQQQLNLIGITGTNGKTTTSFLVEALLKACFKRPGVIGTVNYRYEDSSGRAVSQKAPFTTPEPPVLFGLLREMADAGVTDVVMEVSSHGLAQGRLSGLAFDIAVFTNLSRDHLDFHPDMHHYFRSKRLLFTDYLKPAGRIVLVLDSTGNHSAAGDSSPADRSADWGDLLHRELLALSGGREDLPAIITCGLNRDCTVHPLHYTIDLNGIAAEISTPSGTLALKTPLVGKFNLRNLLCAVGIGIAHDEKIDCLKQGLADIKTIPGRLERVAQDKTSAGCPEVFVDYAHTPDALEQVLDTLRQLNPGRLICVFGCGGDRDPGKRSLMGEAAGNRCDIVLATSDNPRSEPPEEILGRIEEGLRRTELKKARAENILSRPAGRGYDIMVSRRAAIAAAISHGLPGDIVLISGKGHENYQISRQGTIFFDDRLEAEMHLQARAGLPFRWKLAWVQQITGGRLLAPVEEPVVFSNISTDSRTIARGDLFVGLKGDNFDGRMFAEKAVAKGAAGLLLNELPGPPETIPDFQPPVPVILVPDTLRALGLLASTLRRWYDKLRVAAVTGSSGKTTVKEMTWAILSQAHRVLKTEGNFNNLVGLPLTLLRLRPEHEMAVLEMGMNRPGEIARLTEIADPDIACIINVQEAHLEGLGDIHGVARAKNELFAGLKPGARMVVNLDDQIIPSLAATHRQEKITFGCHPEAFVRASGITSRGEEGMVYLLHIGEETRQVFIRALGRHNVTNSLAAAAMAHGCGCGIDEITSGLAAFRPYDKRARIEELPSGLKILNDCYNANPASMRAALTTLMDLKKNHRAVAVLGDMLELGDQSDAAHDALGRTVAELGFDFLAAFGSRAHLVAAAAKAAGMTAETARDFQSKNELVSWLYRLRRNGRIKAGDWLLVKGSRGMRMEEVLELLHRNNSPIMAEGN